MNDWDDLKYLLHVLRAGSTLAASRSLGTSQSTVVRRIQAIELEIGIDLFDKRRSGYAPTDAMLALLPAIEAAERAHLAFAREASTLARGITGTVRVTASESLAAHFLGSALLELRQQHPGIRIELITTDSFLDITSGEADIALRVGDAPTEPTLFGRRLVAEDRWSVCCSRVYAERNGAPGTTGELGRHPIVTVMPGTYQGPVLNWIERFLPPDAMAIRHNSLHSVYLGVKAGLGISALPDIIVLADADLLRCMPVDASSGKEIWLLAPERHRKTAHVRATLDFLGSHLSRAMQDVLSRRAD